MLLGCASGEIEVYNPEEISHPVFKSKLLDQSIVELKVMEKKNLLLAKTDRNEIQFLTLPYFLGNSWVYEISSLQKICKNYSNEIHCERNIR